MAEVFGGALREWARKNGENPNISYDDLNAAEKAEVDAISKRNRDAWEKANRKGNGGINISIPLPNIGIGLKLPCPRPGGGAILPNPIPPSVPTPDLPGGNDTSTNGGTNRVPFATNPSNVTIRTNPSTVNTNPGSTNRTTNGNGRGTSPRAGFN